MLICYSRILRNTPKLMPFNGSSCLIDKSLVLQIFILWFRFSLSKFCNSKGLCTLVIISRINGFTYVRTEYDFATGDLNIVGRTPYSVGERAAVNCYGSNDVQEGEAIMHYEGENVSITGYSTNPTRFQHPVAGTYKKEALEQRKKFFSVASGGGTGHSLKPHLNISWCQARHMLFSAFRCSWYDFPTTSSRRYLRIVHQQNLRNLNACSQLLASPFVYPSPRYSARRSLHGCALCFGSTL